MTANADDSLLVGDCSGVVRKIRARGVNPTAAFVGTDLADL